MARKFSLGLLLVMLATLLGAGSGCGGRSDKPVEVKLKRTLPMPGKDKPFPKADRVPMD